MSFGEIWTARTIGATIIGLTILGVALLGVMQGLDNIKEHRSETDTRRVAGMLEAVDHKPGTVVRLNFVQTYTIDLADDSVTLRGSSSPKRQLINLHSDLSTGSISEAKHVCISNDGSAVSLSKDCSLPDGGTSVSSNPPSSPSSDSPSSPSSPSSSLQGLVALYSQTGLSGDTADIDETDIVLSDLQPSWDGEVRAMKVQDGHTATLYGSQDFSGQFMTVTGTADSISFNDDVKSIRLDGESCQARLYPQAYTVNNDGSLSGDPGPYMTIGGDTSNILNYGDNVKSVEITGGESCYVKLWEDAGPGGECLALGTDDSDCERTEAGKEHANIDEYSDYYGDPGGLPGAEALVSAIEVHGGDACRAKLYNEKDFGGDDGKRYMTVSAKTETLHWPRTGKGEGAKADSVSAITVAPATCQAQIFRGDDFSGDSATLMGETTSLNMEDASSIKIHEIGSSAGPSGRVR